MPLPPLYVTASAWLAASAYAVTVSILRLMLAYTSFSSTEVSGGSNG